MRFRNCIACLLALSAFGTGCTVGRSPVQRKGQPELGLAQPVIGTNLHLAEALRAALDTLAQHDKTIVIPFFLTATNALEGWNFSLFSYDSNVVRQEVALFVPNDKAKQIRIEGREIGKNRSRHAQSAVEQQLVVLPNALNASIKLLDDFGGEVTEREFMVGVHGLRNGRSGLHLVFSFPPYHFGRSFKVGLSTNGNVLYVR